MDSPARRVLQIAVRSGGGNPPHMWGKQTVDWRTGGLVCLAPALTALHAWGQVSVEH